ncbi:MAG: MG2 domain-containing protein [Bacteroidales bacterium]|nr:MG2 domain-containing protein [Bacteroidales bacterium]
MKKHINHLLILLTCSLILACTPKQTIRIIERDFEDVVQQYQNLTFVFNHPIVDDSSLNRWDSLEYMSFQPYVKGKYMWVEPDRLVFSPIESFAPSSDYTVGISRDLFTGIDPKWVMDDYKIPFHTPYLDLESISSYWTRSEAAWGKVEVKATFNFSYIVDPVSLRQVLALRFKNGDIPFTLVTESPSRTIEVSLDLPTPESLANQTVTAVISEGMSCVGSNWKSPKKVRQDIRIPAKEDLRVAGMTPVWDKGMGTILVRTTQPVDGSNLKELVIIEPPVIFSAEAVKDGIMIRGEFLEGQSYKITLSGQIRGVFGKELSKPYSQFITFSQIEPFIAFTEKNALYLSSQGERNLGVQVIHVPRIKLSVFKVFENNLLHYLRAGKQWEWMYENDEYYDFYQYAFDDNFGQLVFTREIETNRLPKSGNFRLLNLDLKDLEFKDSFKGVYLVRVESTEKKWLRDIQMVSLSDIGLIVKEGSDDIHVFTNSLLDATPMPDVRIDFISRSNQVVYSATTDKQGHAVFRNKKSVLPDSPVSMITARKGDDFNFLNFNTNYVETSRFDVGGKRTHFSDYDVFIYGDRDLYRPGDSVFINTVVRTNEWKNVPGIPVKIKVVSPNGRDYFTLRKMLNDQGAAESRILIPADAMTGSYGIEVYSGNDVLMGSSRIRVEEFIPDRIRVTASTDKEYYLSGEDISLAIQATNLFGPPAAGRNYEAELQLSSKDFQPESFPDYTFQVNLPKNLTFGSILREGKTDAQGHASETFHIDKYQDIGILEGRIYTTVFDETGRPVNRLNRFDLFTQELFFGIRQTDYWVDTRRPLHLRFIAVNRDGNKVSAASASLEIVHVRWETVIERHGNRYNYRSEKQESVMYNTILSLADGSATFDYTPSLSGMYEVRIASGPGGNYVSREFYAYGYGDTDYTSFEVSREGEVLIGADKKVYRPGETANVLFNAPFDGTLLVTVERGNVIDYRYVVTQDKAASISFPVTDDYVPNVYISATAIRKIGLDDLPITVAHGYLSMEVEKKENKLDLIIQAQESSRSKTQQTVTVKTEPGAEVTVAVVDEGILQITDYATPDPYAYFYQKRALEVSPYDLYAWLYPELKAQQSSFGGGEGFDLGRRINPLTSKRVRLVSLWSGVLRANSSGECTFRAEIPSFSGSLRVMAIAYRDHRFGAAEKTIRVADPIVISTALPRFLSPDDKVIMPVMLSNTTERSAGAEATLSLEGPLEAVGSDRFRVDIPANSEQQVLFEIKAGRSIGHGEVNVQVSAFNERFTDKVQIPVRPAAGLQKITGSGAITGDEAQTFNIMSDFLDGTSSSWLLVSKSPVTEFYRDLTRLVDYPYGCIEQIVSRAFPLLYYTDLAELLKQGSRFIAYNPDYLVQEAIRKIYSMVRYDGGLLYWPGGDEETWWGTIYAAHFLIEAKKAGFAVDPAALNQMIRYINSRAKDKETEEYYFRDEAGNSVRVVAAKREIFYSLYVLALGGSPNVSLMNHYKPMASQMTEDSRYLLAASYLVTGDAVSYQKLLPLAMSGNPSQRAFGGSFYSHTRDLAITLSTLLDVDPDNLQIPVLSRALSLQLKQQSWLSTQESAFTLMALGKLSHRAQKATVQASVTIGGKEAGRFEGKDLLIREDLVNKQVGIQTTGQGMLYFFWQVDGISATGTIREEDRFMEARKAFFTREGTTIGSKTFEQNDLIIVRISVRSLMMDRIENVAITDLLPACFEIENPRLDSERELTWIKDARSPDYLDIRDDRISFFTTATREWKHFYYTVRAVSKGEYRMGPVSADAMYNGEYHSYNGGGMVVVK